MAKNQWFTAVEQTLPEYIPLPMEQLFKAGQAIQQRYDTNMANIDAVGTGLASIEARLSGHKQYVDNLAKNYRAEVDQLLTKYNNNAADPQFAREFNRIKTKYANDRNLTTIALANEAAKRNEDIAAKLAAEGKLFINPRVTGVDAQGNLTADVGEIRQVNTLDDWANRLKIAASTMNEEGNLITNRTNLNKAKKEIQDAIRNGSPEVLDLIAAYETRGMSREKAITQVAQDAQRLSGEYAVQEKTNWQKLNFEASQADRALDRQIKSLQIAKLKQDLMGSQQQGIQPLKGVQLKGVISAKDLNKDKLDLVKNFRKHIGDDGNLKSRLVSPNVLVNPYAPIGGTYNNPTGRIYDDKKALKGRTAIETLNYMREELGWPTTGKGAGSAKQVADAYEAMIKNDNLVPVTYSPGNATIRNGLSNIYGSNLLGHTMYVDGKPKRVESKDLADIEKSATLQGISMIDGGSVVFRSFKGDKPVTIAVPLDDNTRRILGENLDMVGIIDSYDDNKSLMEAIKANPNRFIKQLGQDYYAPRKTSQGLRYAKVKGDGNNSIEFDRDSSNSLQYLPDDLVKQLLHREYNNLDNLLEYIIK